MDFASSPIEIRTLPVSKLVPNPWNPNRLDNDKRKKLRDEIRRNGFMAPVLARPLGGRFQIVDGEHRLGIAKELGMAEVPCVIVDLDDTAAKIKTLQMNGFRGDNDPVLLAGLLAELEKEMSPEKLARLVPWSSSDLEQMIGMVSDPATQAALAKAGAATSTPLECSLFAVVVTDEQKRAIEQAIAGAIKNNAASDDGEALAAVCSMYLRENERSKQDPAPDKS